MLMATHDLRLASRIADNVVFLDGGVIVETGPARQIFSAPGPRAHEAVRLDDHRPVS